MSDECKKRAPESYIRPTPQERQQVAQNLRDCIGRKDEWTRSMVILFDRESDNTERLADLIDPTCHGEVVEDDYPLLTARHIRCSVCHTPWAEPAQVRYCPSCGCRRVFEADGK